MWDCIQDALPEVLRLSSQADLAALCLVSKASRASTEPFLHQNIEWTRSRSQTPPIVAFLRTILRRPELAAHVRRVALLGRDLNQGDGRRDLACWVGETGLLHDALKVFESLKVLKMHYVRVWKNYVHLGEMETLAALLLSQLHRLTHLVLDPNFTREAGTLGVFFRSALCENRGHYP